MVNVNLSEIFQQKDLNSREINFINKLLKKGGQFTNKDLAKLWGTKNFPPKFKSKLIDPPPILKLIQNRPQKYILISEESITSVTTQEIPNKFYLEFQNLKKDYYKFKDDINRQFKNTLNEIQSLKNTINYSRSSGTIPQLIMEIPELEKEIFIIYNQLKMRPHQPIKIEDIWARLSIRYPNYNWKTFSTQMLKIHSNNFHLEEGIAGRYIIDPINNKKYGYVIGN